MLIYNYKKEFLGIDEHDLQALGFSSLEQLKEEAEDFADLFVKEPGFVHNFKHVHWIDFVECNDSLEGSKVIIKTASRKFKCNLEVESTYLSDNPEEKGFLVYLINLRELITGEDGKVSEVAIKSDVSSQKSSPEIIIETPLASIVAEDEDIKEEIEEEPEEAPIPTVEEVAPLSMEYPIEEPKEEVIEVPQEIKLDEPKIEEPQKIEVEPVALEVDTPLEVQFEEEDDEEEFEEVEEIEEYEELEEVEDAYVYDPLIASSELGLPVDLIEEFIQDFIDQAKEFKAPLYNAFDTGDTANVKALSHKLKGVAANLRIEDALEMLTIINTSSAPSEIKSSLDTFYIIIAKLAGEKVTTPKKVLKSKVVKKMVPKKRSAKKQSDVTTKANEKLESPITKEETPKVTVQEDDLVISFKEDDADSVPMEQAPQPIQQDETDDFIISFKDEEDYSVSNKEEEPPKVEADEIDDFVISFKDDESSNDEMLHPSLNSEENITIDIEDAYKFEPKEEVTEVKLEEKIEIPDEIIEQSKEIDVRYSKVEAAKDIGLDMESFNELFEDYISEAIVFSNEINDAVAQNDASSWQSTAAKLKSMSDNMRVYDFDTILERLAQTDDAQSAQEISQKIQTLISKISTVES